MEALHNYFIYICFLIAICIVVGFIIGVAGIVSEAEKEKKALGKKFMKSFKINDRLRDLKRYEN